MKSSLNTDLSRALDDELRRITDLKIRGWQALGLFVAVAGTLIAALSDKPATYWVGVGGIFVFVWFTVEERFLVGRTRWHVPVHVFIEQTLPWAMLLFLVFTVGPRQALEGWGPPLLFAAVCILSIVQLRVEIPILTGVLGAAQYLAVYFVFARPRLGPLGAGDFNVTPTSAFTRALMLVLGGVLCGFIARGLRKAFGGAARSVRARDLFGKYRLEKELASGGMGSVWLATYCPEGGFLRPAAVKRIHPHLAKDARFVEAFRKEAELGARLVHHNIVQTLDFGRVDDEGLATYFLAMEFVDGCSCSQLVRNARSLGQPLSQPIVARIAQGVLAGLAYAHDEARDAEGVPLRVVHRDLAPQNVLLSTTGLVKITDFGIARTLREHTSALTQAVGHVGHVAPEHIDGKPIDARSDLFLVGVLLWELLTGRALFVRDNDTATLTALLLEKARTASSVEPALAPWDAFLGRALEKEPSARYASATEMAQALEQVIAVVGSSSAAELGTLVRELMGLDAEGARTLPLGGAIGTPSEDATHAT